VDCNKNQVPLLKRLPLDQQPLVARAAKSAKFPPRTVIIKEGPVPWCFVSLAPSLQVLVGLTYANSPGDYCKSWGTCQRTKHIPPCAGLPGEVLPISSCLRFVGLRWLESIECPSFSSIGRLRKTSMLDGC